MLDPFGLTLGVCRESAVLHPWQTVPDSGTGILQVSRREILEKA